MQYEIKNQNIEYVIYHIYLAAWARTPRLASRPWQRPELGFLRACGWHDQPDAKAKLLRTVAGHQEVGVQGTVQKLAQGSRVAEADLPSTTHRDACGLGTSISTR